LVPDKSEKEIVTAITKSVSKSRRYGGTWYWMETNIKKYGVCPELYNELQIGKEIIIKKSILTTSYRKVETDNKGMRHVCDVSFMQDSGLVYLTFITILTILVMCLYEKINYTPGRKHLTIYVAISALVLFFLHTLN